MVLVEVEFPSRVGFSFAVLYYQNEIGANQINEKPKLSSYSPQ